MDRDRQLRRLHLRIFLHLQSLGASIEFENKQHGNELHTKVRLIQNRVVKIELEQTLPKTKRTPEAVAYRQWQLLLEEETLPLPRPLLQKLFRLTTDNFADLNSQKQQPLKFSPLPAAAGTWKARLEETTAPEIISLLKTAKPFVFTGRLTAVEGVVISVSPTQETEISYMQAGKERIQQVNSIGHGERTPDLEAYQNYAYYQLPESAKKQIISNPLLEWHPSPFFYGCYLTHFVTHPNNPNKKPIEFDPFEL